ncbi:MAG: hypothetical protein WKF71_04825 [Pyrinomonadaceae bacterium]
MPALKSETIEKLSHEESEYPPPKIVAENALLKDAKAEYERWRGKSRCVLGGGGGKICLAEKVG